MLHSKHWQGERIGLAFFPKLPQTLLKAETAISHACQTARRLIDYFHVHSATVLSVFPLTEGTHDVHALILGRSITGLPAFK